MATVSVVDGDYGDLELVPLAPIAMHPAAHALHYGSTCFEGLKAHRGTDGAVRLFRVDAHANRMADSAGRLHLPVPDPAMVTEAIVRVTAANLDLTPESPGALYLRPVLLGTLENIGAAAAPSTDALFYVIASPVGDYFSGDRGLRLWVETVLPRTTPQFGRIKTGANYAMALGPTLAKKREHQVDQVLFAPDGDVQETGAANALLLSEDRIVTRGLDDAFLHGVTRDSVLTLARDLGIRGRGTAGVGRRAVRVVSRRRRGGAVGDGRGPRRRGCVGVRGRRVRGDRRSSRVRSPPACATRCWPCSGARPMMRTAGPARSPPRMRDPVPARGSRGQPVADPGHRLGPVEQLTGERVVLGGAAASCRSRRAAHPA